MISEQCAQEPSNPPPTTTPPAFIRTPQFDLRPSTSDFRPSPFDIRHSGFTLPVSAVRKKDAKRTQKSHLALSKTRFAAKIETKSNPPNTPKRTERTHRRGGDTTLSTKQPNRGNVRAAHDRRVQTCDRPLETPTKRIICAHLCASAVNPRTGRVGSADPTYTGWKPVPHLAGRDARPTGRRGSSFLRGDSL